MESIKNYFANLLQNNFMPHGHCYFWQPEILWLHVISDILIATAYYSIPAALIVFVIKKKTLPFNWIFMMFGAFILLCGTTHLLDVWTTWNAQYKLEGLVKALTAIVSVITAIALWKLIPKALALPTTKELESANSALQQLSQRLESRNAELQRNNDDLQKMSDSLQNKTFELKKNVAKIQAFNKVTVGREERMMELKREINELCAKLGEPDRYNVSQNL